MPGIAVRTTFITGFPGETEEDFEELLTFVKNVEFDRVGVFTYSDEEGTPAFELPNKVDPKIAKQRRARLMKEQAKISRRRTQSDDRRDGARDVRRRVKRKRIAVAGKNGDAGARHRRLRSDQRCAGRVSCPSPGEMVNVLITEAQEYDLVGRIV